MSLPDIDDWAVRSGEPVVADTQDGQVLLSLKEQKYFTLNATAAAIWTKLAQPTQLSRVRDALVEEFGVEPDVAGGAVLDFVGRLAAQNIVTVTKSDESKAEKS